MSFQQEKRPFWAKDKKKALAQNIEAVQHLNDDTTSADELLTASKVILYALLAYSGLLGAVSYYKNFEPSFGPEAALFMCLVLAAVIEIGKSYFGKWGIRQILIVGLKDSTMELHSTIRLLALVAFAVATFWMSVINSTRGGEQLSHLLRQEKTGLQMFQPNTADIDRNIETINSQIAENNANKWKGVTSYASQKANNKLAGSLESLNKQKEQRIEQQRADWNAHQAQQQQNGNFAARLVMASGGWVEGLQIIILFLLVSCEKSLISRLPSPVQQRQQNNGHYSNTNSNTQPVYNGQPFQNVVGGFDYRNKNTPTGGGAGLAQSDRGLTEANTSSAGQPTFEAFKQHRTDFYRYRSNLKTGTGDRNTVCTRIGENLAGMAENLSTVPQIEKEKTLHELEAFYNDVHAPILNTYTVDLSQTPLRQYKPQFDTLYSKMRGEGLTV